MVNLLATLVNMLGEPGHLCRHLLVNRLTICTKPMRESVWGKECIFPRS